VGQVAEENMILNIHLLISTCMKKLFILFALFINASLSAQDSLESNATGRFYVEPVAQSRLTPFRYDKLDLGYLLQLNRMFDLRNYYYNGWDIIVTPAAYDKPEFSISIERDSCILVLSEADKKLEREMINRLVKITQISEDTFKINYFGLWDIEQLSDSDMNISVSTYRMTIDKRESIALHNLFTTATSTASYVPILKNGDLTLLPYNTFRICSRDFAGELHTPDYKTTINDNCSRLAKIIDILYEAVRKGDKSLIDNQMKEIISLTEEFKKNDSDIPWERRLTPIQ
jgi:hypothetical protein